MKNKYIYLVFTKTGTWLSRLIFAASKIKYAHASISFDSHFTKMYSFGRINPDNPFSGGFVEENLYDGVFKKFSMCECLIYRVEVTEDQYLHLKEQINEFLSERSKYRYNFWGLLGVLLDMPIKRDNYYFCSQFVSEILINASVFHSSKEPALIRTSDLYSIKNKEIVYEGFVNCHPRLPIANALEA